MYFGIRNGANDTDITIYWNQASQPTGWHMYSWVFDGATDDMLMYLDTTNKKHDEDVGSGGSIYAGTNPVYLGFSVGGAPATGGKDWGYRMVSRPLGVAALTKIYTAERHWFGV